MNTVEVLKSARNLLDSPYAWCKWTYNKRDIRAPKGEAHCVQGALLRVSKTMREYGKARTVLREVVGVNHIPEWNDAPKTRKVNILRALDKAIKRASA